MGLPVTAGPGYVFLALESTPEFLAQSALSTFAIVAANIAYVAVYILAVRRLARIGTTALALAAWFACAFVIHVSPVSLWTGIAVNAAGLAVSIPFICAPQPGSLKAVRKAGGRELLIRALAAGSLVAIVVTASEAVGSAITGMAILFPVTLVTIGWIMQTSYGPAEAIAVMTGALFALPGFALAVLALHFLAEPAGPMAALVVFFLLSLCWAAATLWFRRTRTRRIIPHTQ
jgi:hypothetical protein